MVPRQTKQLLTVYTKNFPNKDLVDIFYLLPARLLQEEAAANPASEIICLAQAATPLD